MNNRPVADYNPNLVGQYVGYNNPEYGMGLTYNNSSNVDPANETGFLEGFDIKNFFTNWTISCKISWQRTWLFRKKTYFQKRLKILLLNYSSEAY